ncbi:GTP-binding domain protein [Yersinia phage fHe-Yen9-02]|nr:GTP-binding domain protein [Yersinia phage fHe-Yen9-02]
MIVGVTGHRPNRLGGYGAIAKKKLYRFAHRILLRLDTDVTIVQGCALGFDQAMAVAAIEQGHKVISMIPYLGFNARWPLASVLDLDTILNRSSEVRIITDKEMLALITPVIALDTRNHAIVKESDTIFALSSGAPSGTQNCIDYALANQKRVLYLWRDWLSFKETGRFVTENKR